MRLTPTGCATWARLTRPSQGRRGFFGQDLVDRLVNMTHAEGRRMGFKVAPHPGVHPARAPEANGAGSRCRLAAVVVGWMGGRAHRRMSLIS